VVKHNNDRLLWQSVDFTVEQNFSEIATDIGKVLQDVKAVRDSVEEVRGKQSQTLEDVREISIQGLYFNGVLKEAWVKSKEASGLIAAISSMVTGYMGAAIDTLIVAAMDWMDDAKAWAEKAKKEAPGAVDYAFEVQHAGWVKDIVDQLMEDPLFGAGGGKRKPIKPVGYDARTLETYSMSSDEFVTVGETVDEYSEEILGNSRGMGDGLRPSDRVNSTAERAVKSIQRLKELDRNFHKGYRNALISKYATGIMNCKGMQKVIERGTT
jgi:hypothetical protein